MTNRVSLVLAIASAWPVCLAHAQAVVTDGRFTNVYVYPDPSKETWDEHLKGLPANQKPKDWQAFTRDSIDKFTTVLMNPAWPSYFGGLAQYGINPPRFFGSYVASQDCVDAALKDRNNGVIEATTIRSLSNCHIDGKDPSPQVNLIFSPDLQVGPTPSLTNNGPNICSLKGKHTIAWHGSGLNTPDHAAIPTNRGCTPNFAVLTQNISHEDVEMVSDPANTGHGGGGGTELGDQCQKFTIPWHGFTLQRYRSDSDNDCWPVLFPGGSTTTTWVMGEGSPVIRFTGDVHVLTLKVPDRRTVTDARATEVQLWIQTGGDDLRGGSNASDNADATLSFGDGSTVTTNINAGRDWGNGQTHIAVLKLPGTAPRVDGIRDVTITTHFGGGLSGDNWNVDKVALMVGFPIGSTTSEPTPVVVHEWLDKSGGPLIRMTGDVHDLVEPVRRKDVGKDEGKDISALDLIISTGNDDLHGGSNPGDNCDVTIALTGGKQIVVNNVNGGGTWQGWTDHTVKIPLPTGGLKGGDVVSVHLHTGFGGGIGGDNWNVQRIQLKATLK